MLVFHTSKRVAWKKKRKLVIQNEHMQLLLLQRLTYYLQKELI